MADPDPPRDLPDWSRRRALAWLAQGQPMNAVASLSADRRALGAPFPIDELLGGLCPAAERDADGVRRWMEELI